MWRERDGPHSNCVTDIIDYRYKDGCNVSARGARRQSRFSTVALTGFVTRPRSRKQQFPTRERMEFWRRLIGSRRGPAAEVEAWRADWARAAARADVDAVVVAELRARLERWRDEEDLEIEREMLDGLEQAIGLNSSIAADGLPIVATGHRVVGTDNCHFIAPASMPDDPAQPSGRLLLTSGRAIFAGGGRAITAPWHALTRPTQTERDLVLVRVDGSALYRFRCNSYGDALCAAIVARQLVRK
jgi:hypothetical protein